MSSFGGNDSLHVVPKGGTYLLDDVLGIGVPYLTDLSLQGLHVCIWCGIRVLLDDALQKKIEGVEIRRGGGQKSFPQKLTMFLRQNFCTRAKVWDGEPSWDQT